MSHSVFEIYQTIDKEMDGKEPLTISIKPEFLYLVLTVLSNAVFAIPLLPKTKAEFMFWMQEVNLKLKTASPTAALLIEERLSIRQKDA